MADAPSTKPSLTSSTLSFSILYFTLNLLTLTQAKTSQCRTSCGQIPINYPFGVDDGCGSPYYRHILLCSESGQLQLRTPSGRYPIQNISYSDPHIIVTDPFMWVCQDGNDFRPVRPFSLDTSTRFRMSPQNDYLFFNCSEDDVIMEPKPMFCERFPEQCDSMCDTSSYLCSTSKHLDHLCARKSPGSAFGLCQNEELARVRIGIAWELVLFVLSEGEGVFENDAQALRELHECLLEKSRDNTRV
ncbi:hypothetical protein OROGR_007304 [Orobanche gracilis]